MTPSQVIIRGRWGRKEFTEPYRQCVDMLESIGVPYSADTDEPIDFAMFFQSYPHEFFRSDLVKLRRDNPFAPFFFVLGACCEGMLRTAGPLDSPFYCYAHAWHDREIEQMYRFLTDQRSIFALPLTAENDEIAQWQSADTVSGSLLPSAVCRPPSQKNLILTHFGPFGNDSAMNQLIADEQRRLGFAPEFCYRLPSAVCCLPIVADADNSPPEKILESIQRLRRQCADNDFTVYVDSPRFGEKNDYIRAGVTRVLPKAR